MFNFNQNAVRVRVIVLAAALLLPGVAWAQTGTIAGIVKDTSGAVMPGVTVEAASPALIEKVRAVVTDGQGAYKIVDLRPGVYSVTFTLTGFNAVKREDIELTSGVTVNVTAELRVGALEETVVVSGQAPLVDVQNLTQHRAVTRNLLDDLPTSRQFASYSVLIPGVTMNLQDVGGTSTVNFTNNMLAIHGSNSAESPMIIEGLRYANIFGTGAGMSGPYLVNNGMVQEIALDMSGQTAEADTPGLRANIILRQGANTFSGTAFSNFSNHALVANNVDAALRLRNVPQPAKLDKQWDSNEGIGGPIKRDKVWFFASHRDYGIYVEPVGAYHALDPNAIIFVPDKSRPAVTKSVTHDRINARLTVQTTKSSKLSLYGDQQRRCICGSGLSATTSYEASSNSRTYTNFGAPQFSPFSGLFQTAWNWTASSKLLVEVGEAFKPDTYGSDALPENAKVTAGVVDSGTGITSRGGSGSGQYSLQLNGRVVVTYVTGSHNLKVGSQWFHGSRTAAVHRDGDTTYNLLNGRPVSITEYATPYFPKENLDMNLGIFVQEQYTHKRLTANLGLRYDSLAESIPAQHQNAVRYVGARDFAAIPDVVGWHDISPRMGGSWDVHGDGKTAVKVGLNRYVEGWAAGILEPENPLRVASSNQTNRNWTDTNGNLLPDCDLTNPADQIATGGECGPIQNANFGKQAITSMYDPKAMHGWGTRGYNWELMGTAQHELWPGLGIEFGYFKRWYGNQRVNINTLTPASAYDPYCVTTPVDSRLPDGGGKQICGYYDLSPTSGITAGTSQIFITKASNIGKITQGYDGFDATANWRGPKGIVLQGGVNVGRTRINYCDVVKGRPDVVGVSPYTSTTGTAVNLATYPHQGAFCDVNMPMIAQLKGLGVYPLPWFGLKTSATFQSLRYPQEQSLGIPGILATRTYTSAEIQNGPGGLGRPLNTVTTTALNILPPATLFEGRIYQIDWRLTKTFKTGRARIQPQFDIYNLLNDNTVLTESNTFGTGWRQPTTILQGRALKFGVQADF